MSGDEVSDFSEKVSVTAFQAYIVEVGRRAVKVVKSPDPRNLDEVVDAPNMVSMLSEVIIGENHGHIATPP